MLTKNTSFKLNDKVKYSKSDYSSFMWYGTIIHITPKSLDIKGEDGIIERIHKKFVNFD